MQEEDLMRDYVYFKRKETDGTPVLIGGCPLTYPGKGSGSRDQFDQENSE